VEERVLETDLWTLLVPEGWFAERDDDSIVIVDEDDVSNIEISSLKREQGVVSTDEINEFAADLITAGHAGQNVTVAGFNGLLFEYEDDEEWVREWYLAKGPLLLLITHCCDAEHQGLDNQSVDQLLSSLVPLS